MANVCEITGKRRLKGNRVSHANNKSRHFQKPNIKEHAFFVPELGRRVKVRLSSRGLRTVSKYGSLSHFLVKAKSVSLSTDLAKLKVQIIKKGLRAA